MARKTLAGIFTLTVAASFTMAACDSSVNSVTRIDEKSLAIGFQGPLSGKNSAVGFSELSGLQMAADEANIRGNLPFTVTVTESDDQGLPGESAAAAQRLVSDKSVKAVIGPSFSGPAKAAGQIYANSKLVTVTPSATSPELTKLGFTSFLRGVSNDRVQGLGIARFLEGHAGVNKVFVINDGSEYGVGLASTAVQYLKRAGITTVTEKILSGTLDYGSAATTIKNSRANALIYAGYYADLAPFARKLKDVGYKGIGISGDGSNHSTFIPLAGEASQGWYFTCPCIDSSKNAKAKAFNKAYRDKFGTPPAAYAVEAYDIAKMIIQEFSNLGTNVSRAQILANLKKVKYSGLSKRFSFDDSGELESDRIGLYRVEGSEINYLGVVK
ncbi:branched-chain amino acid ABC transporter substrate-binding protein [Streptomyces sp. PA03-6a]|nr:branched-chain amino acid ABC transporter substrate-binding protein [Streptomyces sp. PA03-6a]